LCEVDHGRVTRPVKPSLSQVYSSTKVIPTLSAYLFFRTKLITITDREVTRKKYLLSLENRTPEQIAEEEALYVEIKRLEQNERRFKKERDDLLRTLVGVDSGLPDIPVDEDGLIGLSYEMKKRKKGNAVDLDSPSTPSNIISLGPPIPKRVHSAAFGTYPALAPLSFLLTFLCVIKMLCISLRVLTHQWPRRLPRKLHISRYTFAHSKYLPSRQLLPLKFHKLWLSWAFLLLGWSCPRAITVHNWRDCWMSRRRW
jgi:hypothetical protein